MKPLGQVFLIVVVGVLVGVVGSTMVGSSPETSGNKTVPWEYLEGDEWSDLTRAKTPGGWIVEGVDGYMVYIPDPEHRWLEGEEIE